MSRDYKVYVEDIRDAIGKIRQFTDGMPSTVFAQDAKTQDAVIRNLEIIGEAAKHLPEQIRAAHGDADWRKIAGLRDILIYEYFGININVVWDIVQQKLPLLEQTVNQLLRG